MPTWAVACALVLLAGGLALWAWRPRDRAPVYPGAEEEAGWKAGPEDAVAFADSVALRSIAVLARLGVPEDAIEPVRLPENRGSAMRWEVRSRVPGNLPLAVCNLALSRLARRLGGEVIEGREDLSGDRMSLLLGLAGKRTNLVTLSRAPNLACTTGRIAIIIDDVGYQAEGLIQGLCALKQPVTLSIFPGQARAPQIAEQALAGGHGVMVHLPMEPIDYPERDPGADAIFADYSDERIQALTRQALLSVPHARGVNNHMGSRVTEDRRAIGCVLREAQHQEFFFVDSVTSPRSVAYSAAREMGMPCGRNTRFLDLEEDVYAVEQALNALSEEARLFGTVIGIGHAKPATLTALQEMLPRLAQEGFVFLRVEDAVR